MHEMGLAEGILDIALSAAGEQRIKRIRLKIGKLQMVVPQSLEFSFRLAAENTAAAEAQLDFHEIAARVRCNSCAAESSVDDTVFSCLQCGGSDVAVIAGEELWVDEVELENHKIISRIGHSP
jgi:hydrogenase nickel incorporation protein HypA/HybF